MPDIGDPGVFLAGVERRIASGEDSLEVWCSKAIGLILTDDPGARSAIDAAFERYGKRLELDPVDEAAWDAYGELATLLAFSTQDPEWIAHAESILEGANEIAPDSADFAQRFAILRYSVPGDDLVESMQQAIGWAHEGLLRGPNRLDAVALMGMAMLADAAGEVTAARADGESGQVAARRFAFAAEERLKHVEWCARDLTEPLKDVGRAIVYEQLVVFAEAVQ